jgi:diguanylate cyclase (GGDEF)-like protein/PAS domain S-box-containing protein
VESNRGERAALAGAPLAPGFKKWKMVKKMNIRGKFLILITSTCLLYAGGLFASLALVVGSRCSDLDQGVAMADLGRISAAIEAERRDFAGLVQAAAGGLDPQPAIERLGPAPGAQLDEGFLRALALKGSGFIEREGRIYLAAGLASPKSGGQGPAGARLLVGKPLGEPFFSRIAAMTGTTFEYRLGLPPGHAGAEVPGLEPSPSRKSLYGYEIFRGPEGEAVFHVRSETPLLIQGAVSDAARSLILISLLLAAAIVSIGHFSLARMIARPLPGLEAALDTVGQLPAQAQAPPNGAISPTEAAALASANRNLQLCAKVLGATSEAVFVTDLGGTIVDVNDAAVTMSGFSRGELLGKNPRIMKSGRHEPDFYRDLWKALLETGTWSGEIWDRRKGGEIYPKLLSINSIHNEEGQRTHYVGIATEITKLKKTEERLQKLAYYDPLTDLPNRALFGDRLARALSRANRQGERFGLLFIDLDRFKNINDSLGHSAGDALLVAVAQRIVAHVRESDTVCRLGGDEFIVIAEGLAQDENAAHIADLILRAMNQPFQFGAAEIHAGASIGIALFPKDGQSAEELLKKADTAMYRAKEEGRGIWRCASGELDAVSRQRIEIESRLCKAIQEREFRLFYQPQSLAREARAGTPLGLVGAEALIRWELEPGRVVGPGEFLKVAEDCGLIVRISEWAIREACRDAKAWSDAGKPLLVSVNLSAKQLGHARLPEIVAEALATTGLDPRLLRLELTESMFLRDMKTSIRTMESIRATGVSFAIVDFGMGYSSLQYFNHLPVDCLKIDKAFVNNIVDGRGGGDIVSAIISMARSFGLTSIGEGVETPGQLEALRARGCDVIQGFLVSQPLPAEEFGRFALGSGTSTGTRSHAVLACDAGKTL